MSARLGPIAFVLWLLWTTAAEAVSVAVFPMEDLSQGVNGVNVEFTKHLAERLEARGVEVVSEEAIISFMARNRIRWLGFLSTYHVFQAREELGADLILLGTLCQRQEQPLSAVGLTLNLLRTDDARTVWSYAGGFSSADVRHLLSVAEPRSVAELIPVVTQDILSGWPEAFDLGMGQVPIFEIDTVRIEPQHAGPGAEVKCTVRLRPGSGVDAPQVFLKREGAAYLPMEDADGRYFKASWTAPDADGRYPVSLALRWPSGRQRVAFLGTYYVDSHPPAVSLDIKGVRLHGSVAFRDSIVMIPHFVNREPVSRWEITIQDEGGDVVLREAADSDLPPRLVWRGQRGNGLNVNEGLYHVALKVWDRANNSAVSTEQVAVMRNPPQLVLEARKREKAMVVDIRHDGEVPLAFWRVEMRADDGHVLKTAEGETLPAQIDVAIPDSPEPRVECVVVLKDILGNQVRREIKDLLVVASQDGAEKKTAAPQGWVAEF